MSTVMTKPKPTTKWWPLALRGLCAIGFGVLALLWPGPTIDVLVLLFGLFILIDGMWSTVVGFAFMKNDQGWSLLISGLVGLSIGAITLIAPGVTLMILLYLVAAWAILAGVLQFFAAFRAQEVGADDWAQIIAGILSVVLGVVLMIWPATSIMIAVRVVGVYAILAGAMALWLAFRLHSRVSQLPRLFPDQVIRDSGLLDNRNRSMIP